MSTRDGKTLLYALYGTRYVTGHVDDIDPIYQVFCRDWEEDRAWLKDPEFLVADGNAPSQRVDWCPTCRSQKLYEDDTLYQTIEREARWAGADSSYRVTALDFNVSPRCIARQRKALVWLCKMTRYSINEEDRRNVASEDCRSLVKT